MHLLVVNDKTNQKLLLKVVSAEMLLPDSFGKYWFKVTDTNNQVLFIHTSTDFTESLYEYGKDCVIGCWEGCWPQTLDAESSDDDTVLF